MVLLGHFRAIVVILCTQDKRITSPYGRQEYHSFPARAQNGRHNMTERKSSRPYTWIWFNPASMFRVLADNLSPIRWLAKLIWPFAIFAGIAAAFNWYDMLAHIDRVLFKLSFWENLLASMLTSHLASKLSVGMVMSYYRADSQEFGMTLLFGFIPRFYVDRSAIKALELAQRKNCYAATLLAKVVLFAVGILGWAIIRRSGSGASEALLALGVSGFTSFLFVANPLLPFDGCKWLCVRLGKPTLRRDSFRLTYMIATRRPTPSKLDGRAKTAMVLFTIASIAFTAALLYSILSVVAITMEQQLQGAGVLIFCFMIAAAAHFLISRASSRKPSRTG